MTTEEPLRPSGHVGRRLAELRAARGWSQERLARELDALGDPIHSTAIVKLERGTRGVKLDEVAALALALDVSPDVLAFPQEDTEPVALTSTVVLDARQSREWWAGRWMLAGYSDASRQWRISDAGDVFEREAFWRSQRPTREQRAYARPGVEHLVREVDKFVKAAGAPRVRRKDMRRSLSAIRAEVDRQLEALDGED